MSLLVALAQANSNEDYYEFLEEAANSGLNRTQVLGLTRALANLYGQSERELGWLEDITTENDNESIIATLRKLSEEHSDELRRRAVVAQT